MAPVGRALSIDRAFQKPSYKHGVNMGCLSLPLGTSVRSSSGATPFRFVSAALCAWLIVGCGDDDGSTSSLDGGPSATESTTPTGEGGGGNTPGGGGATSTPGNPSAATPGNPMPGTGGSGGDCDLELVLLCDGNTVVENDRCAMSITDVETCDAECHQGECVDCVPSRGVICMDGAVHQLDSCGELGGELEACEFGCSNGRCVAEQCEARDSFECVSNLLVAVDSCGNQGNVEQLCEGECTDDACQGCDDDGETTCYDGDIYVLDSCGQIGSRETNCDETCRTMGDGSSECVDAAECMASQGIACALGDIHTVDSCGNVLAEVVEECPNGCDDDGCRACEPRPVGTQCLGGSIYRLIGGCDDPPTPEEMPLEVCEIACLAGNCVDSECIPGEGRACFQGNVHDVDSCDSVGVMLQACPNGCQDSACLPDPSDSDSGTGLDSGTAGNPTQAGSDAGLGGMGGSSATDGGNASPPDAGASDASTP